MPMPLPTLAPACWPTSAPLCSPHPPSLSPCALQSAQHGALMQAAEGAAVALAGRSREIEENRFLPQDIANALADAGLYRLLTPAAYGGFEAAPASFVHVIERLARADAAAAWCCLISCTASVLAAYLPEPDARAVFSRPTLKAAGVFAPRGRAVATEQGSVAGLRVSGRWAWGSGAHNADIITAGCLLIGPDGQPGLLPDGTPRVVSVLLDRAQVRLLNNWDSFGLCGTGSGEFEVQDAFVPLGRSASLFDGPRIDTPLYRFPVFGLLALAIAAVATGIAREALDAFIDQARPSVPQTGSKPLAARATVQAAVAQAEASLQAARAYLLASIDAAWQAAHLAEQAAGAHPCAAANPLAKPTANRSADPSAKPSANPLPLALRRDIRLAASHAVHTSAALVVRLYTLAGGGAVFASAPLQRCLRNVQVATQHMMVNDASFEFTGRLLLGVPTPINML